MKRYSIRPSDKYMCECRESTLNLEAALGCADDDAAVATLPDHWVPRRGGPILSNYLKEREKNHEKVLEDMMNSAALVNNRTDDKIRKLSEMLLAHIQQNQTEIDQVVVDCQPDEGNLSKDARNVALKSINDLYNQRIDDMATFRREALALERERANDLRVLIRDQFQRLIAVGHRSPTDLLHDFDERTYDFNQQLLSNSRAYTELEAKLHFQADECFVLARSALNQLCLGVGINYRGHSALPWTREETLQKRSLSVSGDKRASEPSLKHYLEDVEDFDECVTRITHAYRAAVMKVFSGFFDKLSDLEKDLCYHSNIPDAHACETFELHHTIERVLRNLSTVHKKKVVPRNFYEISGADKMTIQKSLWSLGDSLRNTYMILHDAGHLWDAHILRSALAQKLTMAAVEDMLTSNDTIELVNEVAFNVAIEQLRVSSDSSKLQAQYDILITMLNHTADLYLKHSEAELGRLEEFMNLPKTMANTLLAEFDCFLEKHPRALPQSCGSYTNRTGINSPKSGLYRSRSLLPRALLQTNLQELALENWRNGFLESFESNVSLVPEELNHQARLWVDERAAALHMRYSIKMVSHSIRLERVKAARDARLAELEYHESRLSSHLNAISELVDKLPAEASEFLSLNAPELYPFCSWVDRIRNSMNDMHNRESVDLEFMKMKMRSYAPRLTKHRRLFEQSLDESIAIYKRQQEQRIHEVRISNVRFMSQIRLSYEGGRYSPLEATRASNALVKGADIIEICMNKAADALNCRRGQLLTLADQYLLPVQHMIDEVLKTGGKGLQDRYKKK